MPLWLKVGADHTTAICIPDVSGDEDVPHTVFFPTGSEDLTSRIREHLTPTCGPFVLVSDSGIPIGSMGSG
jgi:hypothetical protein